MDAKIWQLLQSIPHRTVTSALALGLVLAASLIAMPVQPAWATNFVYDMRSHTWQFTGERIAEKTCLLRAERTLAAYGYEVWDGANDGDRTVQGRAATARVLVACVQEGGNTWALVNAQADDEVQAKRVADTVRGKILGHAGLELID